MTMNPGYESAEYTVTDIILDTVQYRLFRPVHSNSLSTDPKTHFIKLNFIKGINEVNLPSILRSKSVIDTVPTYFKVDREDHFQRPGFPHIIICVFLGYKVSDFVKKLDVTDV